MAKRTTTVVGKREAFAEALSDDEALRLWHLAKANGFHGEEFDTLVSSQMALASYYASRAAEQSPPHAGADVRDLEGVAFLGLVERVLPRFNPSENVPLAAWVATKLPLILLDEIRRLVTVAAGPYGPTGRHGDGLGLIQLSTVRDLEGRLEPDTIDEQRVDAQICLGQLIEAADLTERERSVMAGKAQGLNLAEIGREIGITRERVRQLEKAAVAKMRVIAEKDERA